jgi:hypothetical protein
LYYTYAAISLEAIAAYLDPQKPSEKPKNDLHFCDASRRWMDGDKADCTICSPKCEHSDDSGVFWEGKTADCPICNPKPLHPDRFCPGCTEETFGKMYATVSGDSDVKLPPGLEKIWVCEDCPEYLSRNPKCEPICNPPKPSEKPPTERHGGWISVGSELPSGKWGKSYPWLSEEVLIVNSCSIEIGYYNRQDGAWYVGEPAKEEWIDKITHWMPLPVNPHVCSPKCEHKNGGISYYSEGVLKQWCDDCKEWFEVPRGLARSQKPPTLCPECGGTRQKRKEIWKESSLHNLEPDYVIYERCPRCRGQGVIPKEG